MCIEFLTGNTILSPGTTVWGWGIWIGTRAQVDWRLIPLPIPSAQAEMSSESWYLAFWGLHMYSWSICKFPQWSTPPGPFPIQISLPPLPMPGNWVSSGELTICFWLNLLMVTQRVTEDFILCCQALSNLHIWPVCVCMWALQRFLLLHRMMPLMN